MDLTADLPLLLPKAIAWAEAEAAAVANTGQPLNSASQGVARRVGVLRPELIRVSLTEALPMPVDPALHAAAVQTGLLGPHMAGLTLGYSVFVRRGQDTWRLLSHEFRHVYQYEQAGSIAAFLPVYLQQIVQFGYANCPLEMDARAHECSAP
ncbi:MAG: hypothetical protein HY525_20250 [Betaproteobacteria bacterium]|nr:hypothetical protein [Betaproteobacteria bacterium]